MIAKNFLNKGLLYFFYISYIYAKNPKVVIKWKYSKLMLHNTWMPKFCVIQSKTQHHTLIYSPYKSSSACPRSS